MTPERFEELLGRIVLEYWARVLLMEMPHTMPANRAPKLRFVGGFSDREAFEAQSRGYLSHVLVETSEGRLSPVLFYDAVRLQQDLEESAKQGRPFVADPGMIVLPEVTLRAMQRAVKQLDTEGFFDYLTPLAEADLARDSLRWPPELRGSAPRPSAGCILPEMVELHGHE